MHVQRARLPNTRTLTIIAAITTLLLATLSAVASANHPVATLAGSNFEIDENANLKVDDAGKLDWANVNESRQTDLATGQNDNSYKGGVKEDTQCPTETTGSIPNNKSDLLTFQVYEEPGDPGFLNLAWSRVNDPSGTTLMDFEFNQSTTACTTGPNVQRTIGDLLIEYLIDQGGARANITGRFWNGSAWGNPIDLTENRPECGGAPCAAGTINSNPIPAADSDGIISSGELAPRTFGEAQIDLDLIFDDEKCTSFGSAMLKSRSSDAFNSQLKDFIAPIPIDLQNCGNVIIRKQTDPASTVLFDFDKSFPTDPGTSDSFQLADDGVKDYNDDVLFGDDLTVSEDVANLPTGWDFVDVDCSASSNVEYVIDGPLVTFDINSQTDVLDCTYTNVARASIEVIKRTVNDVGAFDFTSTTLTPAAFTLTTTAEGEPGQDALAFGDLVPGTYDVAETAPPAGWTLTSATCDNGDTPDAVEVGPGDNVQCVFVNTATADLTIVKKTIGADGTFGFTSSTLDPASWDLTTTEPGDAGADSRSFADLAPGTYDASEDDPPNGWSLTSATCDNGDTPDSVSLSTGDNVTCTFVNTASADLTVTKITQDGDGTFGFTSATLDPSSFNLTTTEAGEAGADSRNYANLTPGTYDVDEAVPQYWNLVSSSCDNGDDPDAIGIAVGDAVECTFVNARERGAIKITKTRKHAADGPGDHAHEGVTFTITGGELPEGGVDVATDANGEACLDDLVVSGLVGDYTVTESVPAGYVADGPVAKSATVAESVCGDGNEAMVSFANTPLTDISVAIDSQVDGGTSTVIACWDGDDTSGDPDYTLTTDPTDPDFGDGTLSMADFLPTDPAVTITCQITVDP